MLLVPPMLQSIHGYHHQSRLPSTATIHPAIPPLLPSILPSFHPTTVRHTTLTSLNIRHPYPASATIRFAILTPWCISRSIRLEITLVRIYSSTCFLCPFFFTLPGAQCSACLPRQNRWDPHRLSKSTLFASPT